MSTQTLTFAEFADLLLLESNRGIVNGGAIMGMIQDGKMPKIINDIRGALRFSIERVEEGLEVTQHVTELATELVGEVYEKKDKLIKINTYYSLKSAFFVPKKHNK